jgi:hypothetical protein
MRNVFNKKFTVFGVIALFIILAFSPITLAIKNNDIENNQEKLFDVEITEYKPNGNIEKRTVKFTQEEVNELKTKMTTANTVDQQLVLLKDYDLVSDDITIEDLQNGMYQRASSLGITKEVLPEKAMFRLPILLTFFNKITAVYMGGLSLRIGISPIIRLINLILRTNLPGLDVVDFCGGLFGILSTQGLLATHALITMPGFFGMIGFVGYSIKIPLMMHIFTGLSVITYGFGLGIHIKEWRTNSSAI